MFVRSQRLRKSSDISRIYKRGARAFSRHLRIQYLKNPKGDLRVAVVASKKLDKRAVVRNRAKRRVRELVKEEINKLPATGFDILITVQSGLEEVSVGELRTEVEQLTSKLR